MSSFDEFDSTIEEVLHESQDPRVGSETDTKLEGKFQALSSLASHLGLYSTLTNPGKEDLISALYECGVRNAPEESVFDFLQVDAEATKGFIRSKNGEWIEQYVAEIPDRQLTGGYGEYAKLASFFRLYEKYGLDRPSADKLRNALVNFGVRDGPGGPNSYLAPVEDDDGIEHLVGVTTGKVTTAYPVDANGQRIGDSEYTSDLLPNLVERLEGDSQADDSEKAKPFAPPLPDNVENLLENEVVAENYQLIMHRLAEQAAGDDVSDVTRAKKLAEARFVTEVLTGERTW